MLSIHLGPSNILLQTDDNPVPGSSPTLAKLGIVPGIFAFCGTIVSQNAAIPWKPPMRLLVKSSSKKTPAYRYFQ